MQTPVTRVPTVQTQAVFPLIRLKSGKQMLQRPAAGQDAQLATVQVAHVNPF